VEFFSHKKIEGYFGDEELRRESQGEWSRNSEWMQEIACQKFKRGENLISQMLHGPNLLISPPTTTCPPHLLQSMFNLNHTVQLESPYSTVGAGMYEERERIYEGQQIKGSSS
jgi:hypothetical protein